LNINFAVGEKDTNFNEKDINGRLHLWVLNIKIITMC